MYDRDGLKRNYIMWRTPHKIGIEKKIVRKKRKRVTVALSVVLAFKNSDLNSNSSPRTNISSSFMCGSMFVHIGNPC